MCVSDIKKANDSAPPEWLASAKLDTDACTPEGACGMSINKQSGFMAYHVNADLTDKAKDELTTWIMFAVDCTVAVGPVCRHTVSPEDKITGFGRPWS
jgi:hypothetical protein